MIASGNIRCYVLGRSAFNATLGSLRSILDSQASRRRGSVEQNFDTNAALAAINLTDLVHIRTLGRGALGPVKLVRTDVDKPFALKIQLKSLIASHGQIQNKLNEKKVRNL